MAEVTSTVRRSGRCLCGAVRFVAQGEPRWVAHCHCDSCRRATSAPLATYAGYASENVQWGGKTPASFESSPGVQRRFCARCGSPVSFAGERWPGEIHLFVPSFEDPGALAPRVHVHVGEQLPWLKLADGLPRYHTTAHDGAPLPPSH
jgi:hypothetical protein